MDKSYDIYTNGVTLMLGDCLDRMTEIPDGSVDMVMADPPYGTTACKWDSIIDLNGMWAALRRVVKPNGAIVMTAAQPFTSVLIGSQIDLFKYCLVWQKSKISHFAQAPYRFLTEHEDVAVFSQGGVSKNARVRMTYNPQGVVECSTIRKGKGHSDHRPSTKQQADYVQSVTGYPKSILKFKSDSARQHPTQKPVELMAYLIRTYTNEGETVLDFTMGSGTTGVAARREKRQFIGIEKDLTYYAIAYDRICVTGA